MVREELDSRTVNRLLNAAKATTWTTEPDAEVSSGRHPCANVQDAINEVVRICQYMIGGRHTFEEVHITKGKLELKIARLGNDNKKQFDPEGRVVTDTYTLHAN